MKPVALTIAGSDPSGGAGLQADLKTFQQRGVYGMSVVSLITVQNSRSVSHVEYLPSQLVLAQFNAVIDDIPPQAIKTGALGSKDTIEVLGERLKKYHKLPLVVDPVMISKHRTVLLDRSARKLLKTCLLPLAHLLTPNIDEAADLSGRKVRDEEEAKDAAKALFALGAKTVLIKGGHFSGPAVDIFYDGKIFHVLREERIATANTHGTGCTLSAAITAELAKGKTMLEAVKTGKRFITEAIRTQPGLGSRHGPVNHHAEI